jgi:hypothetical protein
MKGEGNVIPYSIFRNDSRVILLEVDQLQYGELYYWWKVEKILTLLQQKPFNKSILVLCDFQNANSLKQQLSSRNIDLLRHFVLEQEAKYYDLLN